MEELDKANVEIEITETYRESDHRIRQLEEGEAIRQGFGCAAIVFLFLMLFGGFAMFFVLTMTRQLR